MALSHWQTSWWFALVGIFSFALAWRGYRAVKLRDEGWLKKHISGMLGSYIALATALLVVKSKDIPFTENIPHVIFWIMPTLIGVPIISRVVSKNSLAKTKI